jgi:hypothetical protein|tara:strand:+ start:300 stop:500 length:201 start_codon:yes stop_codon:yes gene_type:complete
MTLEKFRRTKKISYIELAAILGVKGVTPESTVFRWCNKERIPRKSWMKIIKEKTKGKVKPSSFYEI